MILKKKKRELLKKQLRADLGSLDLSLKALNYSYKKCIKTGIKDDEYSEEELESFEALTSRFARTADIFSQNILTILFVLIKENPQSFIKRKGDRLKKNLVRHAAIPPLKLSRPLVP